MSKKKLITDVSNQILRDMDIRESMSSDDVFELGKQLNDMQTKNRIEERIKLRCFAIIRGILKHKRYGREYHDKFVFLLTKIGYFNK